MEFNKLGNSGLVVSRMTLGAMTFGNVGYRGFKSQVDQKGANEMVARSLDAGINFFDTADMYSEGESEISLGKALGNRRKDVIVSTKVFFHFGKEIKHGGLSYNHVVEACDQSLRRLGTDYIDLYLLHNVDLNTPMEETARALEHLHRQGKIRYVGNSNYSAWQTQKLMDIQRQHGWVSLTASQVYYSLVGRELEYDVLPQAEDAGLGLMIWSPLAGGFLSGKYTRENPDGNKGRRANFDFPPIDIEKGYDIVEVMRKIGDNHNASPAQVALAWLLTKPQVSTVIVGASNLDQLDTNLAAANLKLADDEIATLDEISTPKPVYPTWIHFGDQVIDGALRDGWTPEK